MKQLPLHIILSRIKRLPLHEQIAALIKYRDREKLFSIRRNELQSVLDGKMLKQLRRENKEDAA